MVLRKVATPTGLLQFNKINDLAKGLISSLLGFQNLFFSLSIRAGVSIISSLAFNSVFKNKNSMTPILNYVMMFGDDRINRQIF